MASLSITMSPRHLLAHPTPPAQVPVDWDPMDIAMWNATPSKGQPAVHSSSPAPQSVKAQCKECKAVELDLFPELAEDSDEEDNECEEKDEEDEERTDESSPVKQSSPPTSPPTAKKVTPLQM